jgi:hypothetical protein
MPSLEARVGSVLATGREQVRFAEQQHVVEAHLSKTVAKSLR